MKKIFLLISIIWALVMLVFTFILKDWEYIVYFPMAMVLLYSILYAIFNPNKKEVPCCSERIKE